MNISGFELAQPIQTVYCPNGYCGSIIPVCFAGISPSCARNRATSRWHHFSFGEHVCHECLTFLNHKSSGSVWHRRLSAWQKKWNLNCSAAGKKHLPSTSAFLAAQLLPWWLQCSDCGSWRQLPPGTAVGDPASVYHPSKFQCKFVSKTCKSSCSWPLDERTTLVIDKPQDFLTSMKTHAWPQAFPGSSVLAAYGIDLVGLSPDSVPGHSGADDDSVHNQKEEIARETSFMFSLDGTGLFSPIDLQSWERLCFPDMARFPTLYLAVRNMILCLWAANPECMLTPRTVSSNFFVRGLLRIVLCERWIPHILDVLTSRGLINIGSCNGTQIPIEISDDKKAVDKDGLDMVTVQLFGPSHLKTATLARQICNASQVRSESRLDKIPKRIEFHISVPSTDTSDDPFSELQLNWSDSKPEPTCSLKEFSPTSGWTEPTKSHRSLMFPRHMLTDRVYLYDNHPLSTLAAQSGLTLRPLTPCMIIYNDPSQSGPVLVPSDKCVRIEFHVEAVLDMVSQLCDPDSVTYDQAWLSRPVQKSWDHLNADIRSRLHDLDESPLEKSLCEFYLASVELDLTEPLTVNRPQQQLSPQLPTRPCPTARLDRLPTSRYAEFMVDTCETPANASRCPSHRLVGDDPHQTVFGRLNQTILGHWPQNESDLISIQVNLSADSTGSTGPLTPPEDTSLSGSDPQSVKLSLRLSNGEEKGADWVVLLNPTRQIRLIFDDIAASVNGRRSSVGPSQPLSIHLPPQLKPLLIQDVLANGYVSSSHSDVEMDEQTTNDPARLITVTLVYRDAWWRDTLSKLNSAPEGDDWDPQQFAFLPASREERGFCHVFRDMLSDLKSPGVLQTQLFALSADSYWSQSDKELALIVHKHLCDSLGLSTDKQERPVLCTFHVARSEYTQATPLDNAVDAGGQPLHLQSDAWEHLAKYGHILFPERLAYKKDVFQSDSDPIGMDVLSTAVCSGLRLAQTTLRFLNASSPAPISSTDETTLSGNGTVEEDTLLANKTSFDQSESTPSRRSLKRKILNADQPAIGTDNEN